MANQVSAILLAPHKRLHVLLQRDGFASDKPVFVSESLNKISFTLENRAKSEHQTKLILMGMQEGNYVITLDDKIIETADIRNSSFELILPVSEKLKEAKVQIEKE